MFNIEETETLEFTYDRPFHISQRHSKLLTRTIWENVATGYSVVQVRLMAEPSEV